MKGAGGLALAFTRLTPWDASENDRFSQLCNLWVLGENQIHLGQFLKLVGAGDVFNQPAYKTPLSWVNLLSRAMLCFPGPEHFLRDLGSRGDITFCSALLIINFFIFQRCPRWATITFCYHSGATEPWLSLCFLYWPWKITWGTFHQINQEP